MKQLAVDQAESSVDVSIGYIEDWDFVRDIEPQQNIQEKTNAPAIVDDN